MEKGKLIVFEGLECCGKTTQIKKLKEYLESKNKKVIVVREPGQTTAGQQIREILIQTDYELDPVTQMLLFNACRSDIYKNIIKKELELGTYIIQDRCWWSTIGYQVFGGGLDLEKTQEVINFAINGIMPNLIFYMHTPFDKYPETFKIRAGQRGEKLSSFEEKDMNYFSKVYKGYDYLANKYSDIVVKIESLQSREYIFKSIKKVIETRIN
jgi:dTMP kinase